MSRPSRHRARSTLSPAPPSFSVPSPLSLQIPSLVSVSQLLTSHGRRSLSRVSSSARPGDPAAAPPAFPRPRVPSPSSASSVLCRRPSPGPALPLPGGAVAEAEADSDGAGRGRRPSFPTSQTPGAERSPGLGAGRLAGSPRPAPRARRVPGRMGCTVSLVCCEALEPLPSCGPQPPATPPSPARPERGEPGVAAQVQRRRLLLQVGSCGPGAGQRARQSPALLGQ